MWYSMVYFVYGITKYTIKYHIQLLKYKIQRLDTGLDSQFSFVPLLVGEGQTRGGRIESMLEVGIE